MISKLVSNGHTYHDCLHVYSIRRFQLLYNYIVLNELSEVKEASNAVSVGMADSKDKKKFFSTLDNSVKMVLGNIKRILAGETETINEPNNNQNSVVPAHLLKKRKVIKGKKPGKING